MKLKRNISILLGCMLICSNLFFSPITANAASLNGWVSSNGSWYYYKDGVKLQNSWMKDSKGWCFLSAVDGSIVKEGWAKDSKGWCYMDGYGYWINYSAVVKDSLGDCVIGADGYWTGERMKSSWSEKEQLLVGTWRQSNYSENITFKSNNTFVKVSAGGSGGSSWKGNYKYNLDSYSLTGDGYIYYSGSYGESKDADLYIGEIKLINNNTISIYEFGGYNTYTKVN